MFGIDSLTHRIKTAIIHLSTTLAVQVEQSVQYVRLCDIRALTIELHDYMIFDLNIYATVSS